MTAWPPTGPDTALAGRRYSFALPARARSAAYARSRARARLIQWNADEETREAAVQVLSELAANAVIHADGETIVCELVDHGLRLHIAVHDQGVGPNSPRANPNPGPGPDTGSGPGADEHGRGLLLVQALSDAWGAYANRPGPGHVVWAELSYGAGL
jgi:anti-sigma regulatory factor (Ser/Thr protein kinase)